MSSGAGCDVVSLPARPSINARTFPLGTSQRGTETAAIFGIVARGYKVADYYRKA